EPLVVGVQLEVAGPGGGPGLVPADALEALHTREDVRPSFVERLHRRPEGPRAVEVPDRGARHHDRPAARSRWGVPRQAEDLAAGLRANLDLPLLAGEREAPRLPRRGHVPLQAAAAG